MEKIKLKLKEYISALQEDKIQLASLVILSVMLLVEFLSKFLSIDLSSQAPLATTIIFALTLFILIRSSIEFKDNYKLLIIVFVLCYLAEIIGKNTGWFFGNYEYSDSFANIGIFGVPIFIIFAWVFLVVLYQNILKSIFFTALSLTTIDVVLEKFAKIKMLWVWRDEFWILNAPIYNFFCWFVLSFIAAYIIRNYKINLLYPVLAWILMLVYFMSIMISDLEFGLAFLCLIIFYVTIRKR